MAVRFGALLAVDVRLASHDIDCMWSALFRPTERLVAAIEVDRVGMFGHQEPTFAQQILGRSGARHPLQPAAPGLNSWERHRATARGSIRTAYAGRVDVMRTSAHRIAWIPGASEAAAAGAGVRWTNGLTARAAHRFGRPRFLAAAALRMWLCARKTGAQGCSHMWASTCAARV